MLEMRLLRSFVVLAEELHFGRAARRLHISQPPLSGQLRRLEDDIGARLFDRTNRHVALTEAGRLLLDRARLLLADAERTSTEVRRVASGETGTLVIAYTPTATYEWLPPLIPLHRARHPEIRLELVEMASPAQPLALHRGRAEVGVACLPVESDGLSVYPVAQDGIVAALPIGHRLAGRKVLGPADLRREAFVGVDPTTEPAWSAEFRRGLRAAGLAPHFVQMADSKLAMLGLVAAGLGVALVSRSMAVLERRGVVFKPVRGIRARLELGLLVPARPTTRAARFVEFARGVAR